MPTAEFHINDLTLTKNKVLNWLQKFSTFCFLDSQSYHSSNGFDFFAGAGVKNADTGLSFGHFSYDYREKISGTPGTRQDHIGFPHSYFFYPEIILRCSSKQLTIESEDPNHVFSEIISANNIKQDLHEVTRVRSRVSKEQYVDTIQKLRDHIHRGDCYEINYCVEFFDEQAEIDPVGAFIRLSEVSPNPFSVLYRLNDSWLICASPERFLKKTGNKLISQPIKGTSPRYLNDSLLDKASAMALSQSEKDKAENVMVVDLVRNDLSIVCKPGSVVVDELFGIYAFPQVYQMISTISGELNENVSFQDIVHACFPMGSMTGAPKKRVMELIDQYETSARGIFSGTVGYIDEKGDFDFNVVIRSLMYNSASGYLSYMAGSGITFYSDPEKEWDECLLKADAIRQILSGEKKVN